MKRSALIMLVAVAAAFAAPGVASAAEWIKGASPLTGPLQWTENGDGLSGNTTVTLEGPFEFEGVPGGIKCTATAKVQLQPGTTGSVTEFNLLKSTCKGNGLLTGCQVTSYTASTPWSVTATTSGFHISNVSVTENFDSKCIASKAALSFGELSATADNPHAISSVTLSGEGTSNLGEVEAAGTLNATPAKKFGTGYAGTEIKLSGPFGFSNGSGGMSCNVNGGATLYPGDQGKMTSFVIDTSSCKGSGLMAGCAMNTMTATTPWPLQAVSSKIHVSEVAFNGSFKAGCIATTFAMKGSLDLTPNNAFSISSLSISGVTTSNLGEFEFSGNLAVSPAGQYGIL